MTMLRHDMDICRLVVYGQQIEDSKLCEVTRDGKRLILDDPSQPRSKKGSIFKIFPWIKGIGLKTKILKEMVMLLRGLGVLILGRNTYVSFFPSRMIDLELVIGVIREGRQPSSSSWFGYHCSKEQSFLCTPS